MFAMELCSSSKDHNIEEGLPIVEGTWNDASIPSIEEIKKRILKDNQGMFAPLPESVMRKRILAESPNFSEEEVAEMLPIKACEEKKELETRLFLLASEEQRILVKQAYGSKTARIWTRWGDGHSTL